MKVVIEAAKAAIKTYITCPFSCDAGFRITATDDDVTLPRTNDGLGGARGALEFNAHNKVIATILIKKFIESLIVSCQLMSPMTILRKISFNQLQN